MSLWTECQGRAADGFHRGIFQAHRGDDPVIIPGDPSKVSSPSKRDFPEASGDAMPPPPARERGAEPLTAVELALLVQKWITMGAKLEGGEATPATPNRQLPLPRKILQP